MPDERTEDMADITHRVGIAAPRERIYEALATVDGLSEWWTREVDGDAGAGGTLRFFFGRPEPGAVMEIVDGSATRHVGWRCVDGPDEWVGTKVDFALSPSEGETVLLFTHADWRDSSEFMAHCSTKWAYFLLGLKASLEGGEATPSPGDAKLSSWR